MSNVPRKPDQRSGKQHGRLSLPHELRGLSVECMLLHVAVGLNRPEAAARFGEDVPDGVTALVADATPELRARCREYIMGHCLAPHAKWQPEPIQAAPEASTEVTVADLEAVLESMALDHDRAAVLALLAAKDPARYGDRLRVTTDPAGLHVSVTKTIVDPKR
jgi:hypothetical protein